MTIHQRLKLALEAYFVWQTIEDAENETHREYLTRALRAYVSRHNTNTIVEFDRFRILPIRLTNKAKVKKWIKKHSH